MARITNLNVRPPPNRRVFLGKWDELVYVCDKIMYYIHLRRKRYCAKRFVVRLNELLRYLVPQDEAIIGQAARSLLCEYYANWVEASLYRQKEVELILRLYNSFREDDSADVKKFALQGLRKQEVIDRFSLITKTYKDNAPQTAVDGIHEAINRIKEAPDILA